MKLTVGSLFSGIGGLDLGLERAGMTVRWQSEIDPYASRVLAKHWPGVPNLGDITKIEWEDVERVDLICGGYPCQPFSYAGNRNGTDDPRHLWPHFAHALRVLRPRFALMENVPGHLSLGFGDVLGDLAALGFDAEWDCIPAAAVGAPHLRYRVFVVASRSELGRVVAHAGRERGSNDELRSGRNEPRICGAEMAHAESLGFDRGMSAGASRNIGALPEGRGGEVADSESVRRSGSVFARPHLVDDRQKPSHGDARLGGNEEWWRTEPDVGRVAHGVPARVDRLRALGNAVVPQVAEWIGRRLLEQLEAVA